MIDIDPTPNNIDTIWLGSNLTPDDIGLKCSRNYLVLKINDTTDLLELAALMARCLPSAFFLTDDLGSV